MKASRALLIVVPVMVILAGCTRSAEVVDPPPDTTVETVDVAATSQPDTTSALAPDNIPVEAVTAIEGLAGGDLSVILESTLNKVPEGSAVLPPGAKLSIVPFTWSEADGRAEVVIEVTLLDGAVDRFAAVLVQIDEHWKIAYTVGAAE